MTPDPSRRDVLAALGACGLSTGAASGTGASTPNRAADQFATDFDHPASALDDDGWAVQHGSFRTEDSYLVADGGAGNLDYQLSRPQESAAGSFHLRGIRNDHPFYGLRFAFVSDAPTFGEPPVAGGTQRGYQLVFQNTQGGGPVKLVRNDGDDVVTLLTLAEDHGGRPTDVGIERDPDTWQFDCYLDGEHVGTVQDDTYTASRYWVQKHGAGDGQRVDGLAVGPGSTDRTKAADGATPVETTSGSPVRGADWLDGWYSLFAWLVGVPILGPLVLAVLVVAVDRYGDEPAVEGDDGS